MGTLNTLSTPLGWMFVLLGMVFVLGLSPRFAGRFYPAWANFWRQRGALVILALIAAACAGFAGIVVQALLAVVAVGTVLIVVRRRSVGRQRQNR